MAHTDYFEISPSPLSHSTRDLLAVENSIPAQSNPVEWDSWLFVHKPDDFDEEYGSRPLKRFRDKIKIVDDYFEDPYDDGKFSRSNKRARKLQNREFYLDYDDETYFRRKESKGGNKRERKNYRERIGKALRTSNFVEF